MQAQPYKGHRGASLSSHTQSLRFLQAGQRKVSLAERWQEEQRHLTVSLHVLSISWGTEESGTYQMWESHSSEPCLKSWWQGSILQCCTICVELSNSEKVRVENWENYTRTQKGNQEKRNKQKLETSCYLPLTVESCLSGHENSLKLIIMELIIRKFCHDEFWMLKKGSLGQAVVAHNFI